MKLSLIAAMSTNRVIGRNNDLPPWNIPEDVKYFRDTTRGHATIMGRRTWESIGSKPLPKRENVVITRTPGFEAPGARVVATLAEALAPYENTEQEVFIAGGGEIYKLALDRADRIYLTLIHREFEGDAYFPVFDANAFDETSRRDCDDPIPHSYLVLDRKAGRRP